MTGVFFSDLDGTLIYSKARTANWADVRVVEHIRQQEASAVRAEAWPLLSEMLRGGALVPVTTRSRDEFDRLELPTPRTAIVGNGAYLLRDGVPDPDWTKRIDEHRDADSYASLGADLEQLIDPQWARRFLPRENLFYVVVTERGATAPQGFDDHVTALAGVAGYVVSRQHRKLYITPNWLTKEATAAHVADTFGADLTLAAGDATLDAGLLAWADEAMHPQHAIDGLPGEPTTASGIDAGLELLTWAHHRLRGTAAGHHPA